MSLTNGPHHAETVVCMRARYDYGAATEGAQHHVLSSPHVAHDTCDAPPEKACTLRMIRGPRLQFINGRVPS
jgi:hypothetical protein